MHASSSSSFVLNICVFAYPLVLFVTYSNRKKKKRSQSEGGCFCLNALLQKLFPSKIYIYMYVFVTFVCFFTYRAITLGKSRVTVSANAAGQVQSPALVSPFDCEGCHDLFVLRWIKSTMNTLFIYIYFNACSLSPFPFPLFFDFFGMVRYNSTTGFWFLFVCYFILFFLFLCLPAC